jgi:Ras-related GTP-binding protein A/B
MPMASTLHSSNNPASLTSHFGAAIGAEQNHVRFLGDLILSLWDCGGQDTFIDSYPSAQRSTIFQHVGVLIYVFEVSAHDATKRDCLDALQKSSPRGGSVSRRSQDGPRRGWRLAPLQRRSRELHAESGVVPVTVFGTSIHDEVLNKVCHPLTFCLTPVSRRFLPRSLPHPLHALHSSCLG